MGRIVLKMLATLMLAVTFAVPMSLTVAIGQENSTEVQICGERPVAVARMPWPSAAILAQIHAQLLKTELGCDTQIVTGDLAATTSSMASAQQPAIAPEMWITRIPDVWNTAIESQNVRQVGDVFTGPAMEGWFIPDFVAEAQPDLTSAASLQDHVDVFTTEGGKAKFISCPPDWACALINRNLLEALGLTAQFEIVEPANRFELDRMIGEAMSSKQPVVFYYWQPNAVLSQFGFRQLSLGNYDADALQCLASRQCSEPKASAFPVEPVVIALSDWVFTELPNVVAYFQRAKMPLGELNALLAWQGETAASPEEAALHFIATRSEIWRSWVAQ